MNRRIIYVEDNDIEVFLLMRFCHKNNIEINWLPTVAALNIFPKECLSFYDLAIVDCRGTTLEIDDKLPLDFNVEGIDIIATSNSKIIGRSSSDFEFCKFVTKDRIAKTLLDFYNERS